MKYPIYIFALLFLSSCNSNRAIEKPDPIDEYEELILDELENYEDEYYEVEIIENGLECDYIFLSVDDIEIDGHLYYGDMLQMNFNIVDGITLSEDYSEYELGRSFLFTTLKGDTIEYFSYDDFESMTEYQNEYDDVYLINFLEVSNPLKEGESYYFYSSYRDEKTAKEVVGKALITIDENPFIQSNNDGLKCNVAYVYDVEEETYVTDNTIEVGKAYYMGVNGLRGFKSSSDLAHYGASIYIEDENGNVVVTAEDLMTAESPKLKDVIYQDGLNLEFVLTEYYGMDVVYVTANFWDKKGGGSFSFQCDFNIIDEQFSFDYDY